MSFLALESVTLADGPQLDAFSRLRTSSPHTLFDSQQEYGLCTRRCWDAVVFDASGPTTTFSITNPSSNGSATDGAGNAVGPVNANTRMCPITVTVDNGDYAILQSRVYHRYIPGKSHLIVMTGVFAAGSGATVSINRRTSASGSVVDTSVAQASWNLDKFDGTGRSGITLDFTKTQILVIDAQWLGVGRVRVGFDVDGTLMYAHEFLNANSLTLPYTQHFNLPLRFEGATGVNSTTFRVGYFDNANGIFLSTERASKGGTCQFVCASVQSEGGLEARGFPRAAANGTTAISVSTRRPVLAIQNTLTYNSRTNRVHLDLAEASLTTKTNDVYWELVVGGTLSGGTWSSVGADAATEFSVNQTSITGGITILSGYVVSGSGSTAGISGGMTDTRGAITISQINSLTATQVPVTLVATSVTGSADVRAAMHWHEQVV